MDITIGERFQNVCVCIKHMKLIRSDCLVSSGGMALAFLWLCPRFDPQFLHTKVHVAMVIKLDRVVFLDV